MGSSRPPHTRKARIDCNCCVTSRARSRSQEHWRPKFLNRDNPEVWMKKGSKNFGEIVMQKAIQILKTHRAEPLGDEVRQAIHQIAQKAEKSLSGLDFVA